MTRRGPHGTPTAFSNDSRRNSRRLGHRCNYIVREGAVNHVYYSQWGALGICTDALEGPEPFTAMIRDCTKEDETRLLDNIFGEGVALVDLDARELHIQGGLVIKYILPVRRAYMQFLTASWPGWSVRWSERGIVDVAAHLGWPVEKVDKQPIVVPTDEAMANEKKEPYTWVSVAHGDVVHDFPFDPRPDEVMIAGAQRVLESCDKKAPAPLPREDRLGGGLLIQRKERMVGWWTCSGRSSSDQITAGWPGWRIEYLDGGLPDQVSRSGRDPSNITMPEDAITHALQRELFGAKQDPVAAMKRLIESAGEKPDPNLESLKYPRPPNAKPQA